MSQHLKELRAKSADIAMKARELFADETKTTEVERMLADHDAIEARIAMGEKLEAAEARANEVADRAPMEARAAATASGTSYDTAYNSFLREQEMSAQTRNTLRGGETRDGQVVGTSSAGGYLVPQLLSDQIVVSLKYYNAITPDNVSYFDTSTGAPLTIVQRNSTASKGRVLGEAAAAQVNAVTYADVVMGAYKVTSDIYKASWELLQDSQFDVGADLAEHMGESVGRQLNTLLTLGAGSGAAPTGLITAVGTPSLATTSNAGVIIDDFLNLEAQVDIAYRKNPKTAYMFNDTTRLVIRKLKDTTGRYYWQPAVTLGDQETFNGYKFIINNDIASQGTGTTFAVFGDMSKFRVRNVKGLFLTRFDELYAASGQVGFMMTTRLDSMLVDTRAIAGIKGA